MREVDPGTISETPNTIQVSAEQISNITDDKIAETFAKNTNVALTGNVTNLSEIIARLETLTDVKTLDLSQITGISELRLDNTKLDSFCEHEESQSL